MVLKMEQFFEASTKGFASEITEGDRKKLDKINVSRTYLLKS